MAAPKHALPSVELHSCFSPLCSILVVCQAACSDCSLGCCGWKPRSALHACEPNQRSLLPLPASPQPAPARALLQLLSSEWQKSFAIVLQLQKHTFNTLLNLFEKRESECLMDCLCLKCIIFSHKVLVWWFTHWACESEVLIYWMENPPVSCCVPSWKLSHTKCLIFLFLASVNLNCIVLCCAPEPHFSCGAISSLIILGSNNVMAEHRK